MATEKRPENSIAQFETGKLSIDNLDTERPRTVYFVAQTPKTKSLYTSTLNGDSLSASSYVGEAKENTPAAMFVKDKQRIIFSLNDGGILQDHNINKKFKWEKGTLESLDIHPREGAAFTAIYGLGKIRLYIQDGAGVLQEIALDDGATEWKRSATLDGTRAAGGEGISAIGSEDEVVVFYANQDFSIHQALFKDNVWTDTEVPETKEKACPPILVTSFAPSKGVYTVQYTDAENKVYEVHEGKRTQIGSLGDKGEYEPKTAAQCGGWVYIPQCCCCCRCRRRIIICYC